MTNANTKENKAQQKLSFFDNIVETIGWLQIAASPVLGGLILGGLIYLLIDNWAGVVTGISVAAIGLLTGIIIASRVRKHRGTMHFMSRVNASPEIDDLQTRIKGDTKLPTEAVQNGN